MKFLFIYVSISIYVSYLISSIYLVCFRKSCCWTEPDCEDLRTGSGCREHGYGLGMSLWVYNFIMLCLIGWRRFYFLSPQEGRGFGLWRTELDRSWSREKSATSTHSSSYTWSCESKHQRNIHTFTFSKYLLKNLDSNNILNK